MYRLLRWALFRLRPETAHALAMIVLRVLGRTGLRRSLRSRAQVQNVDLSVSIAGLCFPNPVGLAAGMDKNATAVEGFFALGFGAVEVGTVTPKPQPGNPRPRVFRIPEHEALINRLGFNNDGADAVARRLLRLTWRPGPIGVNIGKNKDTPNDRALDDYLYCIEALAPHADYVTINVSSPNTPGLRELQKPEYLRELLERCQNALRKISRSKPLFLKIAPDLEPESLRDILSVASGCRLDGIIATNTTLQRPFRHPRAAETGGLSGRPLGPLSDRVASEISAATGSKLPVIAVGGIFSAEDAYRRICAGASMVQLYTALVYRGPGLVRDVLRGLQILLARDGLRAIQDAIGIGLRPSAAPKAASHIQAK